MYTPHGVLTAMITPMLPDGGVDEAGLRAQVRRQCASGVHGIFCLGTNGEFYVFDESEKERIMRVVVEEAAGALPVIAGVGCVTTAQTVRLAQAAQEIGVDAVSVITPYFGQVADGGMIAHYRAVAQSTDLGVILYNIPARAGNAISPKVLETLAAVPNIIGIKDSSGNFDNTLRYLEVTGRAFPVLAGNDSLILSTLMAGGKGAIAATANLFPHKVSQIFDLFAASDIAGATEIQDGLRAIRNCFALGNPNTVVKRAVNLLGFPAGDVRAPFGGDYAQWDGKLSQVLHECYADWS